MGKQLRFYMSDDDETEFIEYLRSTGDVAILPQTSRRGGNEEFSRFSDLAGRELGEAMHLWNRSISPRPIVEHYPQQGYYCLDFMRSEVVNVIRSKMTERGLSMGRLHIEDKFLNGEGELQPKTAAFDTWFAELCRWIKQHSIRAIDGAVVLPGASALIQGGVGATGHVF
jgi:hypothetical protein